MAVSESTFSIKRFQRKHDTSGDEKQHDEGDDRDHAEHKRQSRSDGRDAVDVVLRDPGEKDGLAGWPGHSVQCTELVVGGIRKQRGAALNGEKRRAVG